MGLCMAGWFYLVSRYPIVGRTKSNPVMPEHLLLLHIYLHCIHFACIFSILNIYIYIYI